MAMYAGSGGRCAPCCVVGRDRRAYRLAASIAIDCAPRPVSLPGDIPGRWPTRAHCYPLRAGPLPLTAPSRMRSFSRPVIGSVSFPVDREPPSLIEAQARRPLVDRPNLERQLLPIECRLVFDAFHQCGSNTLRAHGRFHQTRSSSTPCRTATPTISPRKVATVACSQRSSKYRSTFPPAMKASTAVRPRTGSEVSTSEALCNAQIAGTSARVADLT